MEHSGRSDELANGLPWKNQCAEGGKLIKASRVEIERRRNEEQSLIESGTLEESVANSFANPRPTPLHISGTDGYAVRALVLTKIATGMV